MTEYWMLEDASDLSPSWPNTTAFDNAFSLVFTGGPSEVTISLTASQTKSASFITPAANPNSDDWEDGGTWTMKVSASTSMNMRARMRAVRLTSTGTIDQSGTFTSYQTFTSSGSFTWSPVAPTWSTTEACSHRLAFEFEFDNLDTMMTQEVTLQIEVALDLDIMAITDIDVNGGTCPAPPSSFTPRCIMF